MLPRPLAVPSGFARTLLRLCFAKLLSSFVGEPDGFAAGASRAQATRPLRGGRISRAAEGDLKMVAAGFGIFVDRLADECFRRAEETIHLVFASVEEFVATNSNLNRRGDGLPPAERREFVATNFPLPLSWVCRPYAAVYA